MGVARSIEERLEGFVEGFFTKLFRSGVQPIEVGRRILREMAEGRTISVNRVYAPNEFRVLLGPEDHQRFSGMQAGLEREFSDLVVEQAKENRWNLMGLPRISFEENAGLGKGEFRVEASLTADAGSHAPEASTREPRPDDPSAMRAISSDTAERLGVARSGAELLVLDRSGKPRERISITRAPVTIGRLSTCDVVLSDSNVSRRHAELRDEGGRWVLVDLGSTNGTLVNGKLARRHELEDGDRLGFGTTELVFNESGGR